MWCCRLFGFTVQGHMRVGGCHLSGFAALAGAPWDAGISNIQCLVRNDGCLFTYVWQCFVDAACVCSMRVATLGLSRPAVTFMRPSNNKTTSSIKFCGFSAALAGACAYLCCSSPLCSSQPGY